MSGKIALFLLFSSLMLVLAFGYEAHMIKPARAIISVNIRILSDPQSGQLVTQIDWGTLVPGQTASRTFYFISESNVNVSLSLSTRNWSPAFAEGYFSLNWNISGKVIKPGENVRTAFILSVSNNAMNQNNFCFDTIITATGNFPQLATNNLLSTGLLGAPPSQPVGGLSFATGGYIPAQSLTFYLALTVVFAAAFTTVRRKTNRRMK